MPKISSKSTWEGRQSVGKVDSVLFSDIFHQYLTISKNKTCLEIGCVPGSFLAYIGKTFKYKAEGIDYVKNSNLIVGKTLEANGIKNYQLYEKDFLAWEGNKKYDLVCSFGFIEHFSGKTNEKVIEKHLNLLKPGGKLILEVPNFRYFQYLIHFFLLTREILKEHNLKTMNLSYYKKIAKKYNLKVLHLDYYGGFFNFWGLPEGANVLKKIVYKGLKLFEKMVKNVKINNRFLSPYIIFVAEKSVAAHFFPQSTKE